ncbi:MAG: TetR/AcrR family transcriptional regulator [Bacteroidota bacterium]
MNKTKMKIVLAAIDLFNQRGLANVLNQEIASAAGISLSNFNYHFKTKKDLVYTVCNHIREILEARIKGNQVLTHQGRELEISKIVFEFQRDYRFFYLDTHNILQTYPGLKDEMQKLILEYIQIIKNLNYMAIGVGHLKPEPEQMPGLYDHLARQIWISSHFWLAQSNIRGMNEPSVIEGLEAIYAVLYPYLTASGIHAYRDFIDGEKQLLQQTGKGLSH